MAYDASLMQPIQRMIATLRESPSGAVFNPWYDVDPDHDSTKLAPQHRRDNLIAYLTARTKRVRWVFIAEAVGFRGGKFSGIAMTCERQLAATDLPHHRTSVLTIPLSGKDQCDGVLEPTAMIVGRALAGAQVDPRDVVLWNTFAWHPHQPGNRLTNRTPKPSEVLLGVPVLKQMLGLFPNAHVVAIGKTCQRTMSDLIRIPVPSVRHPANGGATEFTLGIHRICKLDAMPK